MTAISSFTDVVRPYVQSCPESAIEDAVLRACITLCEQSLVVQEELAAVDVTTGDDTYTFTASSDTQPLTVISLFYNDFRIYPKTRDELEFLDPGWQFADPGKATYFIGLAPDTIQLNRVADEDITDGLVPTIATRPEIGATTLPDIIYENYLEAIRYGAVSYLQELPDKKWTDIKTSIYNGQIFNTYIQRARAAILRGFQVKSVYARQRTW